MGEMRNAYKILVRKTEGRRLLRGHRRRWKYNNEINHRGTRWEGVG
jgi:hypothetical protein